MKSPIFMILRCDDCCSVDAVKGGMSTQIGFIPYVTCFITAFCSFLCENNMSASHFDMPFDDFLEGFMADFGGVVVAILENTCGTKGNT